MDDDHLTEFIERTTRLRDQRRQRLNDEEIRSIALQTGLSDDDLQRAKEAGEKAMVRGRELLRREHWDDAVEQFETAAGLLPGRLEPRLLLARAHGHRFCVHGDNDDRDRARQLAHRCLHADPDSAAAYDVLDLVESASSEPRWSNVDWEKLSVHALLVLGICTVIVLVLVVLFAIAESLGLSSDSGHDYSDPAWASSVEDNLDSPPPLDVELVDETGYELNLDVRDTALADFGVGFQGTLTNDGDYEINELHGDLEYFDDDELLATDQQRAIVHSSDPTVRPGDNHGFSLLQQLDTEPDRVRIIADRADVAPAASSYPDPKLIDLDVAPRHDGWSLNIAERHQQWDTRSRRQVATFRGEFEVGNTSGVPIEKLEILLTFYDRNGVETKREEKVAIYRHDPPILPGEARVFSAMVLAVPDYDHYRMKITNIE